jgi:hypothetical protein
MCAILHHNSSDTTFWSKIKLHLESITQSPATIILSSRKLTKVWSNLKKHCEVNKTTIIHAILLHIPNVTTYRQKISFHQKSPTQTPLFIILVAQKRWNVWAIPKIHCEVYKTTIIHAILLAVLVTNSYPVSTHACTGSVNPYPNITVQQCRQLMTQADDMSAPNKD